VTDAEAERYSRQIRFSEIGREGQDRLLQSHVAVVGCGALGSFQAGTLARAGIGRLTIIDRDYVELSNLQRQWLFDEGDAEQALPKAVAAARNLAKVNSGVVVTAQVEDLSADNIEDMLGGVDLILDGTDNFETRYLLNDFAVSRGVPWVYGAAVGSYGLSMAVIPGSTSCLKCLYPEPPEGAQPTCETAGVLGAITSIVASLQVSEALKILCTGESTGKLTRVDAWTGEIRQSRQPDRDAECMACGLRDFVHLRAGNRAPISLCGRNAVQIHELRRPLDLALLAGRLSELGAVRSNEFALRFETPPYELTAFADGRVIVKGTTDIGIARSVYSRFIGG
jgi:molybdopterin/thiamine biosynthesis adenylyltransferase